MTIKNMGFTAFVWTLKCPGREWQGGALQRFAGSLRSVSWNRGRLFNQDLLIGKSERALWSGVIFFDTKTHDLLPSFASASPERVKTLIEVGG